MEKPMFDERQMTLTFTWEVENEDTGEYEERTVTVPARFCVCSRCNGKGSHVNPAIDGHGITAEEWAHDWSNEEKEMYLTGGFDISCEKCDGKRVIPVPNKEAFSEKEKAEFKVYEEYATEWYASEREYESFCRSERMMGA